MNLTSVDQCLLKCDKVRISQVIDNLISNAIKYTDSGEIAINVSCDSTTGQAAVSIKDSGIGVSREDLNQLFSKFKQLTSTDRSRKGTGLGLVVSKGIVEAHGGKIWAESAGENFDGVSHNFVLKHPYLDRGRGDGITSPSLPHPHTCLCVMP